MTHAHLPDDELPPAPVVRPGFYRHFKGGLYQVLFVATHAGDPRTHAVIYWSLALRRYWVREHAEFTGTVARNGTVLARFAWLGESPPAGTDPAALAPRTPT